MSINEDKLGDSVEVTDFFSGGEERRREMLAQPEQYLCYCTCYCTTNCAIGDYMHPHTSGYFISLAYNPGSTGPGGL